MKHIDKVSLTHTHTHAGGERERERENEISLKGGRRGGKEEEKQEKKHGALFLSLSLSILCESVNVIASVRISLGQCVKVTMMREKRGDSPKSNYDQIICEREGGCVKE